MLDEAVALLAAVDLDSFGPVEQLKVVERLETSRRRQIAISHALIGRIQQVEGWPRVHVTLSDGLRISRAEARRRLREAEGLAPRTTVTGESLPPKLPATSDAWRKVVLDREHLRVIQSFVVDLPFGIDPAAVEQAESLLAEKAAILRPDQLQKVADRLALLLNPDGKFSDDDCAARRGFTWWGARHTDGMSVVRLIATPYRDARFAGDAGRLVGQVRRTRNGQSRRPVVHPDWAAQSGGDRP